MLNPFKNKNLKSLAIGIFSTLNMLVPNNKQQSTRQYTSSEENKNAIEHFYKVNDAREAFDRVSVEAEIDKRVEWFQNDILKKIYEEDVIVKDFEKKVRKAKSKSLSKILDYKKDRYITQQYLDRVNLERKINSKEPYCLGFIMHNMMKFDEMNNIFNKFPGVAKLSNRFFINQAKMTCKNFLYDTKKEKVKPDIGDIIVLKRADGSHHAVTYIGKNLTFSANGNDHGGRSELKKVRMNYWKRQATNFYIFKSKDVVKEYWQEKYKNSEMTKLEFLAELYKDRELPNEVAIMLKQVEEDKSLYANDLITSSNKIIKSSTLKHDKIAENIKFVKSNDVPSFAKLDDIFNGEKKLKSSKAILAQRKSKNEKSNKNKYNDTRVVINDNRRRLLSLNSKKAASNIKITKNEDKIKIANVDYPISSLTDKNENIKTSKSLFSKRKNVGQTSSTVKLMSNSRS